MEANFTVTFQILNTNGAATTTTQSVALNGKPSAPSNPSTVTFGGRTYTFKGWTTVNAGSSWYVYSNQTLVTPSSQSVTANTIYYAVYTTNGYTVTFQYLNSNGSSTSSTQTVVLNGYPTNPGTPSAVTVSGTTYTFYAWSTNSSGSPWYVYKNQATVTPTSQKVTGNITYYALYTAKVSTEITVTAEPGKSTDFDIGKFQDAYRTKYSTGTVDYVEFTVPTSYSDFRGVVNNGSKDLTREELRSGKFYYSGGSSGSRLKDLSFAANNNARNGDSLTLTYYAYNGNNSVSGSLILKVSGTSVSGDIEYEVDPGKTVELRARDFRNFFNKSYKNEDLGYVRFENTSFDGTFYHEYNTSREVSFSSGSKLSSEYFYDDPGKNQYDLDELTFKASSSFKKDLSIKFTAYAYGSSSKSVTGTLVISSSSKNAKGDIEYEVAPGKSVDLQKTDFRDFLRDEEGKSAVVDYVQFKQPSSSSIFDNGKLYYNRGGGNSEVTLTRSNINGYKFYYSPGSKDYDLDDLTFVAGSNFKDEITLDFTVYGTKSSQSATGTLVIKSTSKTNRLDNGDINYKVAPGQSVSVTITDFRALLRKEYNSKSDVDYVQFSRPSSTSVFDRGTLYYNKGGSDEVTLTRSNISSYKFYYDPGRNDYGLSKLSFTAGSNFKDNITLDFTIYGEDDDEELDGTLVFYTDVTAAAPSGYVGSIRYNTVAGTNVQIKADDINRFLRKSLPGYTLQYVTFTGVPATGGLYYNYYGASKYGSSAKVQITSANRSGMSFYFNPTSTAQYALTELTYVPSSYNYCASIPFTAYAGSSLSVNGTILISVTQKSVPEVYGVTTRGREAAFSSNSIYNAVLNATGSALYSIQLLSLPSSTAGTVYVGSGTSVRAATNVQYTYADGANSISQLRFVPSASYTGSVEIPYVALNSSGTALASGVFALGVVNTQKSFRDVANTVWCYKYVTELSDANVIGGYNDGSFKPDSTLSYGAALKLIMLAAGYPAQAPTGKNVFSGYLAKARADGLVTRSNVNLSGPITRLQVAQLAASALKLNTGNLSTVKPFTDTTDPHVQALNAAGIVEGYFSNGTSVYKPNNSLTRGQMSAIVWRMQNYRKG